MSSTTPSPPTLTTSPVPNSVPSKNADYFFGFLISFVILLVLLVGGGIVTKRITLSRVGDGAGGNDNTWRMNQEGMPGHVQPVYWDAWMKVNQDKSDMRNWEHLQPISASFTRPPSGPNTTTPAPQLFANVSWLPTLPVPSGSENSAPPYEPPLQKPDAVHVAVIIAMPRPHDDDDEKGLNKILPECQIGISKVQWDQGHLDDTL